MNNDIQARLNRIDNSILAIYLTIAGSIIYLILVYKARARIIDDILGTNSQSMYPNTTYFNESAVSCMAISSGILLYYSYLDLLNAYEEYKKTGNKTDLIPSYNYFHSNILQFVGNIIVVYNVFVLKADVVEVTN